GLVGGGPLARDGGGDGRAPGRPAGKKWVAGTRRRIQESTRSVVRATDMRAPSLRVEGRPRQADRRLPLELNCQSEKLNPLAAARVTAARGEPLSSLLPVRADHLTRRR